jgi:hypothetical protein
MYFCVVLVIFVASCIATPKFDLLSAADAIDFAERYATGKLNAGRHNANYVMVLFNNHVL